MAFVADADVQIHLPADKLKIEEIPDDLARAKEDAERIVRGYLAGVFESSTISGWTTPTTTPEQIRAITGRFTAAAIYRLRYSVDSVDDPKFAQAKYNEAMTMLKCVIEGDITLINPGTGLPITDTGTQFDSTFFEPNNDTTVGPVFTMGARY